MEGQDAANKLVILARVAFDTWLDPAAIATRPYGIDGPAGPGITTVSLADQTDARSIGRVIKLLASTSRDGSGRIRAGVLPTAVPIDSPLGRTAGVSNRIEVDGVPVGRVGFDGPGAGGPATASAVLGDLIAIARSTGSSWAGHAPATAGGSQPDLDRRTFRARSGIEYPIDD